MASKLAVQMYTVREFTATERDVAETLEKIAQIGYRAVQLSAVAAMNGDTPAVTAQTARKMLDDNGLKCIATHRSWDNLVSQTDAEIAFHQTLGCNYVAIGGLPGDYGLQRANGYMQWIRDARPTIEKLSAAGIAFGYHNHAHEFERCEEVTPAEAAKHEPLTFFEILIRNGAQDKIMLELDLYWAWHAGIDPSALVEKCAGRVPVIHIKDREVVAKDGPVMAPIGEGNLPWKTIIAACEQAGVEWYAVEQDVCRRDPFDCLRSSFDFLMAMGL